MVSSQKIVMMGMDNAGKTTIINTLSRHILDPDTIAPTQQVERTKLDIFGRELNVWDFGGQDKYREKYLQNPEKYIEGISFLFFVVDLQDPSRFDFAVDYFNRIIEVLLIFSPEAKIVLIFHKNDPDKHDLIKQLNIEHKFRTAVSPYIQSWFLQTKRNPKDPPFISYRTSVFNPMTIIQAWSAPLLGENSLMPTFTTLLQSIQANYQIPYIVLFSKNHFQLAEANSPDLNTAQKDQAMMYYLNFLVPTTELKVEFDFENDNPLKLYTEGFPIKHGGFEVVLYSVFLYEKSKGLPVKEEAMVVLKKSCQKLLTGMNSNEFNKWFV